MLKKKTKRGVDIRSTFGMKSRREGAVLFVVADRSHARLFEFKQGTDDLKLIKEFKLPEAKMKTSQIVSDRPGRTFNSFTFSHGGHQAGTSRHAYTAEEDPKSHLTHLTAKKVADWLDDRRTTKQSAKIILVVAPQLMGSVQSRLKPGTLKQVAAKLEKDYSWLTDAELKERLLAHLPNVKVKKLRLIPPPLGGYRINAH